MITLFDTSLRKIKSLSDVITKCIKLNNNELEKQRYEDRYATRVYISL